MAKKASHPDVTFYALDERGREQYFDTLEEAALLAFLEGMRSQRWVNLNVVIRSEAGAEWWGGPDAVALYRANPDAQVFQQYSVKVQGGGMIP